MKRVPVKPGDLAYILIEPHPSWGWNNPICIVGPETICDGEMMFRVVDPDTGKQMYAKNNKGIRFTGCLRQQELLKISPDDGQFDLEVKYQNPTENGIYRVNGPHRIENYKIDGVEPEDGQTYTVHTRLKFGGKI